MIYIKQYVINIHKDYLSITIHINNKLYCNMHIPITSNNITNFLNLLKSDISLEEMKYEDSLEKEK